MSTPFPIQNEKIYTGNKGKLIDESGFPIQETAEFESRIEQEFGDVKVAGSVWTGQKLNGVKGRGRVKLLRISPTLRKKIADAAAAGVPFVTQFIGEVGNDLTETERILLQNVVFTGNVDLVKFVAQQQVEDELEFAFTGFRFL